MNMIKEDMKKLYNSSAYKALGLKIGDKVIINDSEGSVNAKITSMALSNSLNEEKIVLTLKCSNGKERHLSKNNNNIAL